MGLLDNSAVSVDSPGSGIHALDNALIQASQHLGVPELSGEKLIDASIRQLAKIRQRLTDGWNSPFSREQTAVILDMIEGHHVAFANDRMEMKPYYFKLLEGKIEKATNGSAAFDLFATEDVLVGDTPVIVPTGVRTEFHPGLVAIIKEKSGLSVNKSHGDGSITIQGLEVKAGVIDSDYRDEWKVVLRRPVQDGWHRSSSEPYPVKVGQKIAQVVLVELPKIEFFGDGVIIKDAIRDGGFGSTGSGLTGK